ncbi:MAG: hypothetical protein ACRDP1_06300 [Nocardioidaceae bacterium]
MRAYAPISHRARKVRSRFKPKAWAAILSAVALVVTGATAAIAGLPGSHHAQSTSGHHGQGPGHRPHGKVRQPASLLGASVQAGHGQTKADAVARESHKFGHLSIVRLYYQGPPGSWQQIHSQVGHRPVVVSFKLDPQQVVSGKFDSYMRHWFKSAPLHHRTFWSYYHEPENNIAGHQFTATQYRAAWAHLKRLANTAHNWHLRSTLILMCWSLNPHSGRNWHDYLATGSINVLGWDCYNKAAHHGGYGSPQQMLGQAVRASAGVGIPWGIGELGSKLVGHNADAGRAKWLKAVGSYVIANHARFVTYFDSTVGGDFRLMDRPSQLAWGSAIAKSRTPRR